MKIVTIANRKGGTGKTTTAFNLAYSKANEGKKVLLLDLDSQGNLTKACNKNFSSLEDFVNVKIENITKNIDLLAACKNYRQIEKAINDTIVPTAFVQRNMLPKISGYDFVFIDTSPAVNILNTNGFLISDMILIVMQLDYFSLIGLDDMYDIVRQVKDFNPNLEYKIIVNQYQKNRKLDKKVENKILQLDNLLNIFIPNRQIIKDNISNHLPSINCIGEYKLISECV